MPDLELFPKENIVGIFRGFQQGGLEFHADLVLPYRNDLQNIPMHGQFVLVQLETPDEAVLGRIASFSSEGRLSYGAGEEFNIRAVFEGREIPDNLREDYLRYRVNIRVLGVVRKQTGNLLFVPSHRRLPHVGSRVAFPSGEVLREVAGHNAEGAVLGHLAFGEFIYAQDNPHIARQDWMQIKSPEVTIRFPVTSLVSRRTFVFARAGFGKSNLNKLLFSHLYKQTPTVTKRGGKQVPVGTVLFDPEGEYFWPDDRGRPGLCDVPELEDKLVVFTDRKNPSPFYQSFVAGGVKLDIRRLSPSDVISIALSPERQEQQNVRKLRGLTQENWEHLVDLIARHGNSAPLNTIQRLLELEANQQVEALAARGNMTTIVNWLHDSRSQMMDKLIYALSHGKLCVVDVSRMRGAQAFILSALVLRYIFNRNQDEFTSADPKTIPTIAVIEEAQSVLNEKASAAAPYIEWVKEGRKYDLGAMLITQQPGSIPVDILSQGDNWFIFHLLSAVDLTTLKRANAHFSDDILSSLLNEPIPGQGVFWSSVEGKPYPVSVQVLSFENMYPVRDAKYDRPPGNTLAQVLNERFVSSTSSAVTPETNEFDSPEGADGGNEDGRDLLAHLNEVLVAVLENRSELRRQIESERGLPWGVLGGALLEHVPQYLEEQERRRLAFRRGVVQVMNALYGERDTGWETYRDQQGTLYIRRINRNQQGQ